MQTYVMYIYLICSTLLRKANYIICCSTNNKTHTCLIFIEKVHAHANMCWYLLWYRMRNFKFHTPMDSMLHSTPSYYMSPYLICWSVNSSLFLSILRNVKIQKCSISFSSFSHPFHHHVHYMYFKKIFVQVKIQFISICSQHL